MDKQKKQKQKKQYNHQQSSDAADTRRKKFVWPVRRHHILPGVIGIFVVAIIATWVLTGMQAAALWDNVRSIITGTFSTDRAVVEEQEGESITAERLLDGIVVDSDEAAYVPYAVMMENLLSVRPQSGLGSASVVYEALVEGGATRFMAVFDPSTEVSTIMPVRSARPYYLEWAMEYNLMYVHAGGSPKAITVIREQDIRDLDALSGRGGKYFWRDTSRFAPHNLVTSSEKMNLALRDLSHAKHEADFAPWLFKNAAPIDERGADGKALSFNFSYGTTYKVDFTYDRTKNKYLRSNSNQPHLDANTGGQIAVDNVIVQLTEEPTLEGGKGRLEIFVGGTGDAWVARDGQMIKATWRKNSNVERTRYYDMDGNEIELNRGTTWVHILTKTQEVTYQ